MTATRRIAIGIIFKQKEYTRKKFDKIIEKLKANEQIIAVHGIPGLWRPMFYDLLKGWNAADFRATYVGIKRDKEVMAGTVSIKHMPKWFIPAGLWEKNRLLLAVAGHKRKYSEDAIKILSSYRNFPRLRSFMVIVDCEVLDEPLPSEEEIRERNTRIHFQLQKTIQ